MAAPVLANRVVVFVNKVGTDDAGYNAVGAPWSRLTVAAALADALANYPAATAANPIVLALGPGTYTISADLQIPPNYFITGSADDESSKNTILQLTSGADIKLSVDWANGACIGGLANLVIRGETVGSIIDFTVPTPLAGNPARVVGMENITTDLTLTFTASSTADVFLSDRLKHDGDPTDLVTLTGGVIQLNDTVSAATNQVGSKAGFAGTVLLTANRFALLILSQVATALTVSADVLSLATITTLSQVGAPTIVYITDANGLGYTPAVPASWPVGTDTVQEALDSLASGSGGHAGNGTLAVGNAAGNTTVSPTKATWTSRIAFTGAASTRVVILDIAAPPIAGDTIDLFGTRTDGGGIVAEVRNATAGGTLLATFPDGTGYATWRGQFVYGTIATGYAANAWVAQGFQIPATS